MKLLLVISLTILFQMGTAFHTISTPRKSHQRASVIGRTAVFQSARPNEATTSSTTTEDVLIQAADRKRRGLRQEYGVTVKKDGLDPLRQFVWGLFDISQVVFTGLGAMLAVGLMLNLMGYGYFFDDHGNFVVQTLQEIQRTNMMDAELLRLSQQMADTAQQHLLP